ncbi:DUF3769 domain-containing protein [Anabaena sp. CCY 9402-a]|uniref:DUF3769 domain-containing protein n=1 Tax=Anabaena sp. CCY 9402-a TaxID=3103867 RepID=UPI0039C5D592
MLHPVLPPTPPPLVEPIQPANSTLSAGNKQFSAVGNVDSSSPNHQEISPAQPETPPQKLPIQNLAPEKSEGSKLKIVNAASPNEYEQPIVEVREDAAPNHEKAGEQGEKSPKFAQRPAGRGVSGRFVPLVPPASLPLPPTSYQPDNLLSAAKKSAVFISPPEAFAPEFSPLTTHSATNLGQPLVIGYPIQKKTDSLTQVFPSSRNYEKPVVTENLIKQEQKENITVQQSGDSINLSVSATDSAPTNQAIENVIEFKSRNATTPPSVPSSIKVSPSNPQAQTAPNTPPVRTRIVEITSDRQEYDEQRRIVTAEGNVVVRFDGAVVDADRVQVNLDNLIAVGQGNVALTRGDQVLRGQRFSYNFLQDSGDIENGSGEINVPSASEDFAFLPTDITGGGVPTDPPSDRIRANQPTTGISSPGGLEFTLGGTADASNVPPPKSGGEVKRLRFEARQIEFYPRGWQARNVRITNDPFSPPELELRADKVTVTREAPLIDRITTERQRLVFDQNFVLPLPINQQTIDRRERETTPLIVSPGYDGTRRGGLFVERGFTVVNTDKARLQITPQFFVQRAIQGSDDVASLFGVKGKLNAILSPKAILQGSGELTSFDLDKVDENLKASLRLRQTLGDVNPHIVNWEYSYRDRLYNGTLGFQTVQSSLGGVITSPVIALGKSGINLSYQAGAQYINANTDRQDLLEPNRENDRISLGRFQTSAALSRGFLLWQGKPLAPTATEGLKYTPRPVVPYLQAIAGVTGTTSYYTNGDNQNTLIGTVGLVGQIGNFSRPFLDYTAFNVTYSQGLNSGLSPFLFDRSVDNKVLGVGISQQIYGPFRLGFQTSVNLDTGRESSTDYILEYSRRTYGITLRYNPVLELGGFSIRISDFNWTGGTDPFSDGGVRSVVGGVRQEN